MFSRIVPENWNGSWSTMPIWRASESRVTSRTSWPSIVSAPVPTSKKRESSAAMVVLPAPVFPTSATVWPAAMSRSMSCRTGFVAS